MNVRTTNIIGMLAGFIFGSSFTIQLEYMGFILAGLAALSIIFSKQILKGPFWGLIAGILLGYSLRSYLDTVLV